MDWKGDELSSSAPQRLQFHCRNRNQTAQIYQQSRGHRIWNTIKNIKLLNSFKILNLQNIMFTKQDLVDKKNEQIQTLCGLVWKLFRVQCTVQSTYSLLIWLLCANCLCMRTKKEEIGKLIGLELLLCTILKEIKKLSRSQIRKDLKTKKLIWFDVEKSSQTCGKNE